MGSPTARFTAQQMASQQMMQAHMADIDLWMLRGNQTAGQDLLGLNAAPMQPGFMSTQRLPSYMASGNPYANAYPYTPSKPRWRPRRDKPLWRQLWLRSIVLYMQGARYMGYDVGVSEAKVMAPAAAAIFAASAIMMIFGGW